MNSAHEREERVETLVALVHQTEIMCARLSRCLLLVRSMSASQQRQNGCAASEGLERMAVERKAAPQQQEDQQHESVDVDSWSRRRVDPSHITAMNIISQKKNSAVFVGRNRLHCSSRQKLPIVGPMHQPAAVAYPDGVGYTLCIK
eukprot:TRINITY_DN3182_c0_g1_i1.p1 TRINITY_DN3182_c0_g1~~TRINITY_DN3182_c0_g1_i1.p1  ORF type:complete len:146 (+),score=7.05 TRINITY_DN3182_c0_g1_i1:326-763(+)